MYILDMQQVTKTFTGSPINQFTITPQNVSVYLYYKTILLHVTV